MAAIDRYYCMTCNTDLGADGNLVDSHLAANPTHTIGTLIIDSTETLATVQGITRIYDDELFTWDESRQKWLGVNRRLIHWGIPSNNQNNVYLRLYGSITPSNAVMGYYVGSEATITKIRATRTTSTSSTTLTVRAYGGSTYTTFTLNAGVTENQNDAVDVNVTTGNNISVYISGTSSSSQPQCFIEFARRIP